MPSEAVRRHSVNISVRSERLEGGIPLLSTHPELRRVIGTLFSVKMVILVITLVGCLSICRFFCKVMCPLGAIYGLLNKVSLFHMDVNMGKCIHCGKCTHVCPMDVDPVKTPDSAECIRCGKCVSACPKKALKTWNEIKTLRQIVQNRWENQKTLEKIHKIL